MKTAKDRFHEVMDNLSLNDYKVYTSIEGITKNMMSKLRQGHTEEVSVKILMPFCEAFPQVNANYILTGKGSMFLETEDEASHFLTYDELVRQHDATIANYNAIIDTMKKKFYEIEKSMDEMKEMFSKVGA